MLDLYDVEVSEPDEDGRQDFTLAASGVPNRDLGSALLAVARNS